jgi:hypothetical protein
VAALRRYRGRVDTVAPGDFVAFGDDISYGRSYCVRLASVDRELGNVEALRAHWLVLKSPGRLGAPLAALVPEPGSGIAQTRDESWDLPLERRRFRWKVVVRTRNGGRPVAVIAPGRPNTYRLELYSPSGGTTSLRLRTKRRGWVLTVKRGAVRHDVVYVSRHTGRDRAWGYELAYELEVASRAPRDLPIALLTVLSVHCVILNRAMTPPFGSGG